MAGGILYPHGKVWGNEDNPYQWERLGWLLGNATDGVRESEMTPTPKVILHTEHGGKYPECQYFFNQLRSQSSYNDYDIIGLSFYPWWQGSLDDLRDNIPKMISTFGKEVGVVETGYPFTMDVNDVYDNNFVKSTNQLHPGYSASADGQRRWVKDLKQVVHDAGGLGVMYWAPEWMSVGDYGTKWENIAMFDFNGQELPAVEEMGKPMGQSTTTGSDGMLETTTASGNGSNGAMFDVKAKNDLMVTGLDIIAKAGTYDFEVFTRRGTYNDGDAKSDPGKWTRIQQGRVTSSDESVQTPLPKFSSQQEVKKNEWRSFYVRINERNLRYTNGSGEGELFRSDANIEFYEGRGVSGYFDRSYSPRVFNGCIHYTASSSSTTTPGSQSLTTTMSTNNGSGGSMFDVTANRKIRLDGFDVNLKDGTYTVEVYTRTGSYAGNEHEKSQWYLIQTAHNVVSNGQDKPTPLPNIPNSDFEIWAGVRQAFYIRTVESNSMRYVNGENLGAVYAQDDYLTFYEGDGISNGSTNGFGSDYSPRVFSGTIRYTPL